MSVVEQKWSSSRTASSPPSVGTVTNLLGAENGTLLASFVGGGAVQVGPDGRVLARTEKNHPKCCSMRLARTPSGEMWLGGNSLGRIIRTGGLLKLEDHPLRTQPATNVLTIKYEERTRKLWACYNGGILTRSPDGTWQEITTRDGLLVNGCWSLAPLPNGDVWDAYLGLKAMARIRPGAGSHVAIRQYGPNDGIPEPGNDAFDADRHDRLWRAGDLGTYVTHSAEAEAGNWLQLNQSDGFPSNALTPAAFSLIPMGPYGGGPIMTSLITRRLPTW